MDGLAGICSKNYDENLVRKLFLATGSNQHRGKTCAGLAIGTKKGIYTHKKRGRIGDLRTDVMKTFQDMEPGVGIGNVGYTKNRIFENRNIEPIEILPKNNSKYQVFVTMDGHIVNANELKSELETDYTFETNSETEIIGALLHNFIKKEGVSFEAGEKLVDKLHGRATFSLTALVHDGKQPYLIALNDDKAFEPFCYGTIDDAFLVSSESTAHRRLGGSTESQFKGAEMIICSPGEDPKKQRLREEKMMQDVFQAVYFGNAASTFWGKQIFEIRRELGKELIKEYGPTEGNIIIPNPESGWGVTIGLFEASRDHYLKKAFDFSDRIPKIKDVAAFNRFLEYVTVYPALVKQAQAVRTFQEAKKAKRFTEVGLKFSAIDSLLNYIDVDEGDDSTVKGSVGEGGSNWAQKNAGIKKLVRWISYGPMFFPSFKEWDRGEECLYELAVQRAFKNDNPYNKSLEEINKAVAELTGVDEFRYNKKELIEKVTGPGSFQALDASYPISEEYLPDFIKREVEKFREYR